MWSRAWLVALLACGPARPEPLDGAPRGRRPPTDAGVTSGPVSIDAIPAYELLTCLSAQCKDGYAAAWFEADQTTVVGAGWFRDGILIDGTIFELSGDRTFRIDVSEDLGMVHRDAYAVVLDLEPVGHGLRAPTGTGRIEWQGDVRHPPSEIQWAGGIWKIGGPARLVEQAELDLIESQDGMIAELGGLILLRTTDRGAWVANVGASTRFTRGSAAELTISLADGTTGKLVVAGGKLTELPLPAPSPSRTWKLELRTTVARIQSDLDQIDAALAELRAGLANGVVMDELRAVAGSMQTLILDALHQSRDLPARIPAKERERRIAAFLLPRALGRLQPHIEAVADIVALAEASATTTPLLASLLDRVSLTEARQWVTTLAP